MRRLLFNHFPKTGGCSISSWLEDAYRREQIYKIVWYERKKTLDEYIAMSEGDRLDIMLIVGHWAGSLIEYAPQDTVRATVVRHPINRMVSFYYYERGLPEHYEGRKRAETSLVEYVASHPNSHEYVQNGGAEGMCSKYCIIGFQENLQAFCRELCSVAEITTPFDNRHWNCTKSRPKLADVPSSDIYALREILIDEIIEYQKLRVLAGEKMFVRKATAPSH